MTVDEQIAKLNEEVRCTLGPSDGKGIGVFTIRRIQKGEPLYTMDFFRRNVFWYLIPLDRFNEIRPEIRQLVLDRWAMPVDGRAFNSPNHDQNLMSFMNHSDDPNSKSGIALRDIGRLEEVTENYNDLGAPLAEISKQHYSLFLK